MVGTGAGGDAAADRDVSGSPPVMRLDLIVLGAILALALLVRLGTYGRTAVIFNDGPVFLDIAEKLGSGRWAEALAAWQHPGYPLLIRVVEPVVGDGFGAAIIVSLVFGCAAVAALYVFLAQAWSRRVAAVGALLLAVNPYAARFSADVQSESVYLFFFLAAVAAAFAGLRHRAPGLALLCGVLAGLAYLVRPEGIGVAVVAAALVGAAWLRGGWGGRAAIAWIGALLVGAAAAMAPYLLAVRELSGGFRLTQKKSLLAILGISPGEVADGAIGGSWPRLGEDIAGYVLLTVVVSAAAVVLVRLRGSATVRVRVGPIALAAALILLALAAAVSAPASFGVLAAAVVSTLRPEALLLVVVGVLARVRREPSGRSLFVAAMIGLYAVVLFGLLLTYGYLSRRHVLPPLTLLLGYAGAGAWVIIGAAGDQLRARGIPPARAAALATGGLIALLVAIPLPKAWHDHRAEELPARRAAEWMRDHALVGGLLASNRLKHGWYAERQWHPLRYEGQLYSAAQLRQYGVRWMLLERDLLDERGRPAEPLSGRPPLQLVERHRVVDGERLVVVFELTGESR